jgi:transcriptional regulator of NAD metabolism
MLTLPYSEITEAVQSLKYEDKLELKELLNHYLIEDHREDIYKNYQVSKKEVSSGKVKYYKSSSELRKALENSVTFIDIVTHHDVY